MKLSASKLHLAQYCIYPFAPGVDVPRDEVGEAAKLGTAWHAVVERIVAMGPSSGPAQLIDECLRNAGLDPETSRVQLTAMRPVQVAGDIVRDHVTARAEVSYGYDPESGEAVEIGLSMGRRYPEDVPMPCTVDVVWTESQGDDYVVVVRDWKTGNRDNVEPAAHNLQLALLALCAARVIDCDAVRVELAFISPDGDVDIDAHTYAPLDLIAIDERIGDIWARVYAPGAAPEPGPHCTSAWCPLRFVCSSTQSAIAEVAPATVSPDGQILMPGAPMPLVVASPSAITGPEHAAWVRHRLDAVIAAYDQIEKVLKAWVAEHGAIDCGDGKVWGPITYNVEEIISYRYEELVSAITLYLPEPEVRKLVAATVTKTALEAACKAAAQPRKGAEKLRAVMSELQRQGVVRNRTTTQHRVHAVKGEQTNAA